MFISVYSLGNRYAYIVGDSPADHPNSFFSSAKDFYLSGEVNSSYGSFGDAHAAGSWLISERSSHIMAKKASYYKIADEGPKIDLLTPENVMVSHYGEQIELINQRFLGLMYEDSEDNKETVEEAKIIKTELESLEKDVSALKEMLEEKEFDKKLDKILESSNAMQAEIDKKFGDKVAISPVAPAAPMPNPGMKAASVTRKTISAAPFIKAFSYAAMKALQSIHEDVYIRLIEYDEETDSYNVYLSEPEDGEKDLILLRFDSDLFLTDVMPSQTIHSVFPYHTSDFFERYWEPIVTAIGHIKMLGANVVAVPNMNLSNRLQWEAFDEGGGQKAIVDISVNALGWNISKKSKKEASSRITESELKPGETDVKCVNPDQDAYYGRTGKVTSVSPSSGLFLVRVDFGRGLGPIWMKIEDLEKVTLQV